MALPSGYKQVEYIESTGTQWIDTGVYPNANTKMEADLAYTTTSAQYSGNYTSGSYFMFGVHGNHEAYLGSGVKVMGAANTSRFQVSFDAPSKTAIIAGSTNRFNTTMGTSAIALPIFAHKDNSNGILGYAKFKLYSFKIYSSGNLVRDFVPCINSSSVAGLFDKVNNVFYTNKGSGTFIAGEVVDNFDIPGHENIGGILKSFIDGYENVGGVLKKILIGYQNVGGVLVPMQGTAGTGAPRYVWKKYSVVQGQGYVEYLDSATSTPPYTSNYMQVSSSYSFNSATGIFSLVSPTRYRYSDYTSGRLWETMPYGYIENGDNTIYKIIGVGSGAGAIYGYKLLSKTGTTTVQGSYIGDVTSENENAYPDNGIHTDGYWYIKQ